jgi:flagellar motor switch/type III secretory pathway protein FliN
MGHSFAAARPAALHCPELIARGPRPEESAALLAAWRRDLARLLADDLSGLLSGDRLDVSVSEPDRLSGADALQRIGPVAANALLRVGASGETALLSFDFATAIALTDRSFGGDGRISGAAPEALPRSAALVAEEAAIVIARAITCASFGDTPQATDRSPFLRSESAARLKPFALDAEVLVFTLDIANRQGCIWRASLFVAANRMARLLPGGGHRPPVRTPRAPATGMAAPFADMPLPLHVVLAEFDLSLARLQTLSPGDMIPLAIGRQVPLMVGDSVIAHGSVGTAEDHMAIRLTRFPVPASHQGVAA